MAPDADMVRRIEGVLGRRCVGFERIGRGYTPAERWVVTCDDGVSFFCKVGTSDDTSKWLRQEYESYCAIRGSFLPRCEAFDDDGERPILILEDLSHGHWPPPWDRAGVDKVLAAVDEMAAAGARISRTFEQLLGSAFGESWNEVARDPEPFLGLGLCTGAWLERALPELIAAQQQADLSGGDLGHFDIRSDNICLLDDRALLVDWNFSCLGDRRLDIAFWLPSLHEEGGPAPEEILPDAPELAALVSGFFAARAGLPVIPHAPRVRQVQQSQLGSALPWAVRALDLPRL